MYNPIKLDVFRCVPYSPVTLLRMTLAYANV